MNLSGEQKFFIGTIIATIAIVFVGMFLVNRPAPTWSREQLLLSDTVTKGKKEANIYLIEFSDFQCPACKAFKPSVDQIMQKNANGILFGYRHFPLPQHQFAQNAALAFEAANEQGKPWEMYDYLFDNQETLSESIILDGAKKLNLNIDQFKASLTSAKTKDQVAKDTSDGRRFGVNSTPTFFLNGRKLDLGSPADLIKAVEEEIKKKK